MNPKPSTDLSRRQFLQAGAAATVGLAALSAWTRAEKNNEDAFGGFTLGVQS
jgi:phosphodiesterase/alkaline phosphatase D-like protein